MNYTVMLCKHEKKLQIICLSLQYTYTFQQIYRHSQSHPRNLTLHSSSSTTNNLSESFDEAIHNIVNIIVTYIIVWSKGGNGRSYDSQNGYGTIIGFLSGRDLDYTTRKKKHAIWDVIKPILIVAVTTKAVQNVWNQTLALLFSTIHSF